MDLESARVLSTNEKKCPKCEIVKPAAEWNKSARNKDGLQAYCKACWKVYVATFKKSRKFHVNHSGEELAASRKALSPRNEPEIIKTIVAAFIENPAMPLAEVAAQVGVDIKLLRNYCNTNAYLKALRLMASQKITTFLPKAIKGFEESLESASPEIKFKASVKMLENENVLGATKIDVTLNDMRNLPSDKLHEIINQAKLIPAQTIEGELA